MKRIDTNIPSKLKEPVVHKPPVSGRLALADIPYIVSRDNSPVRCTTPANPKLELELRP